MKIGSEDSFESPEASPYEYQEAINNLYMAVDQRLAEHSAYIDIDDGESAKLYVKTPGCSDDEHFVIGNPFSPAIPLRPTIRKVTAYTKKYIYNTDFEEIDSILTAVTTTLIDKGSPNDVEIEREELTIKQIDKLTQEFQKVRVLTLRERKRLAPGKIGKIVSFLVN